MEQPAKIMITATTPIRLQEIQETLYDGAFVKKMFQELIKKNKIGPAALLYNPIGIGHYIVALCQDQEVLAKVKSRKGCIQIPLFEALNKGRFFEGKLQYFVSVDPDFTLTMARLEFMHQDTFAEKISNSENESVQIDENRKGLSN